MSKGNQEIKIQENNSVRLYIIEDFDSHLSRKMIKTVMPKTGFFITNLFPKIPTGIQTVNLNSEEYGCKVEISLTKTGLFITELTKTKIPVFALIVISSDTKIERLERFFKDNNQKIKDAQADSQSTLKIGICYLEKKNKKKLNMEKLIKLCKEYNIKLHGSFVEITTDIAKNTIRALIGQATVKIRSHSVSVIGNKLEQSSSEDTTKTDISTSNSKVYDSENSANFGVLKKDNAKQQSNNNNENTSRKEIGATQTPIAKNPSGESSSDKSLVSVNIVHSVSNGDVLDIMEKESPDPYITLNVPNMHEAHHIILKEQTRMAYCDISTLPPLVPNPSSESAKSNPRYTSSDIDNNNNQFVVTIPAHKLKELNEKLNLTNPPRSPSMDRLSTRKKENEQKSTAKYDRNSL